jgi:hypothetical protein
LDDRDPEETEHKADKRQYLALVAKHEAHQQAARENRDATQWLADNARNRNRSPNNLGNSDDITAFVAVVDGGAPAAGYDSRDYFNGDRVMPGGRARRGRYLEVRRLPGSVRVIADTANAPRMYYTNGGTHLRRAGHAVNVQQAWWTRWDGARWWYWDATNHQDEEFSRGTLVAEVPLTSSERTQLQTLGTKRTQARNSGRMKLINIWNNTPACPI